MPRGKHAAVSEERHHLRLVQQVPPGTPGAFVDPIMGASWIASRKGLGGRGGFVSVQHAPILNDATEFTATLPVQGSDGVDAGDRFYCLADSIDPSQPAGGLARVAYFPGDEWIEVYRGESELLASGTPISPQVSVNPPQVQLKCRDVMHPLKKTRETSAGFWCNAPRDVLEHYTRLWLRVFDTDFADSLTKFPAAPTNGWSTTTDGISYERAYATSNGTIILDGSGLSGSTALPGTVHAPPFPDGFSSHASWRCETQITAMTLTAGYFRFSVIGQSSGASSYTQAAITFDTSTGPGGIGGTIQLVDSTGAVTPWPVNTTGLADANNQISPPYTIAIEARDRWYFFYLDGQCVGVAPRGALQGLVYPQLEIVSQVFPGTSSTHFTAYTGPASLTCAYIVARRTSQPLNGGNPGDYFLPSPPAPGGLTGEYFDLAGALTSAGCAAASYAGAPVNMVDITLVGERVDELGGPGRGGTPPDWQYGGLAGAFMVRWTGAIYLPLDTQDVTFQLPAGGTGTSDMMRVWVGKTRAGEQIITNWQGDTPVSSSVGMRSLFGQQPGWYPILVEYYWAPTGGSPGAYTGNSNPFFAWDVPTVGHAAPVPSQMLAPLGMHRTQVNAGDSHYDTLKTVADEFTYQFLTKPMQLESGWFPGAIIPRRRVGRDTDYELTVDDAIDPQLSINAEDVASTVMAAAQGLGGSSTGTLTAEAFNFDGLPQHPFISQEFENLPSTTVLAQLVQNLLSLLGYRSSPFEDVTTTTAGARQKQDTFPLTGQLAEFDWQPGDGVRVKILKIYVNDLTPRQILQLTRMLYPDGVGENQASFRPRNRNFEQTMRKFIRQVYGARRSFQGQIVETLGTAASTPGASDIALPADLKLVRDATIVVLWKSDRTIQWQVAVNGTVPSSAPIITVPGEYNIGPFLSRQGGTNPRLQVGLVNPSASGGGVFYQIKLRTLVADM